jgi:acyl-CoA synthetase (AMP-forming)/AMP-acid ligase II
VLVPRFSATTFWHDFQHYQCNWYSAVPTIHQILLKHHAEKKAGVASIPTVRFIRSCSAALAPSTLRQLEEAFRAPVIEAYAMTEAAHQMTSNPLPPITHKPGSVGFGQGVDVTILNDRGRPCREGEVCIKGTNVTKGYFNNPDANATAFTADGWFRTGDRGYFDEEGYLFLTGRLKELINRGGEKISPLEIDAALLEHPKVAEAVSFAAPDAIYGEVVHAAVVLKGNDKASREMERELQTFCKSKLVAFKCPQRIYFLNELPRTATGKIQRRNVAAVCKESTARL